MEYIRQHRNNIKEAFKKYGYKICKYLNIDYFKLKEIIGKHDLSKYTDIEYESYRQYFYPNENEIPNRDKMNIGWLHHQNHNKHHPEYWYLRNDKEIIVLDMDNYSIAEMLLDWEAMSMYQNSNTYEWYLKNKDNILFSEKTKEKVDDLINIFK